MSLAIISERGIEAVGRPEPDSTLTDDQACEWREIVNRLPADWFPRETWPLLAQYCRHAVTSRRLGQLVDAEMARSDMDLRTLKDLLTLQRGETSGLKALAAAMRLAQQSTWNAKSGDTAKSKRTVKRLWEG